MVLGPDFCRCGSDNATGGQRRNSCARRPPGWASRGDRRPGHSAEQREPGGVVDCPAEHEYPNDADRKARAANAGDRIGI